MGEKENFTYIIFLLYEREKIRIRNSKSKFCFFPKLNTKEKKFGNNFQFIMNGKKSENWSRIKVYQNLLFSLREFKFIRNPEIFFSIVKRGLEVNLPNFLNLSLKKGKIFFFIFFIFEILWKYTRNSHFFEVMPIFFQFLDFPTETFFLLKVFLKKIKYFFNFRLKTPKKEQNYKPLISMPDFFMALLNIWKKNKGQKLSKKMIFAENFEDFPVFRKFKSKKIKFILLNKKNYQKFEFEKYFFANLLHNQHNDFNSQFLTKKLEIFKNGKKKFKRLFELLRKKDDKLFIFIKKKKKRFILYKILILLVKKTKLPPKKIILDKEKKNYFSPKNNIFDVILGTNLNLNKIEKLNKIIFYEFEIFCMPVGIIYFKTKALKQVLFYFFLLPEDFDLYYKNLSI